MPATAVAQQQQPLPGQLFDVPGTPGGETQWSVDYEPTQGLSVTLAQGSQVTANGILPFKQTDVVTDWVMEAAFSTTFTAGTGQTLTASPYAPMNLLGPIKLLIQNQYSSVDVESGIDLYIFDVIRPERATARPVVDGAAPFGVAGPNNPAAYPAAALAQTNLEWGQQWTSSVTAQTLNLRLPAGQWFDVYYDRAITGEVVAAPHAALVSPQYMAGTTRVITPQVKFNQLLSTTTTDVAPVYTTSLTPTSDSASTASGTCALTFRRHAVYAGNPAVMPPVYAWQYRRRTDRFAVSGQSKLTIPLPLDAGQVMCSYVRLYDPSANSGVGAPISFDDSTILWIQLQYGSGLLRFNGTPSELQELWIRQHGVLLPKGVFAFDLALDERGLITNKRCLNTLTTAGIQWVIQFASAQSATAYAVLGTESLVYVT